MYATAKRTLVTLALVISSLGHGSLTGQGAPTPPSPAGPSWKPTLEERVWGLMQVWSGVAFAFPSFDRRPELDWDARVQEYLPRVMAAQDGESYYETLMELVTLLRNGHTFVTPPWGPLKPGWDAPPLELQVVEGRFLVARVGDSEEIKTTGLAPGMEVLGAEGIRPFRTYYQEKVLRRHSGGSPQSDEAGFLVHALMGPKGSTVTLLVKDFAGQERQVILSRDSAQRNGRPFLHRFMKWNFVDRSLEIQPLPSGVVHVRIPNFRNPALVGEFQRLVETLDPSTTKGLLLDLRFNTGGSSQVCDAMVQCLIDRPTSSPQFHYPVRLAPRLAWGQKLTWETHSYRVQPRTGARYTGPLVALMGPATASSAEDMALMLRGAGRALLVGELSAGSSGNAYRVALPGGGQLRVATFRATAPDGTDYAEMGIKPDIEAHPTAQDLSQGRDTGLQKAEEVLKNWSTYGHLLGTHAATATPPAPTEPSTR